MAQHTLKEGSTMPDTCQHTHSHVDPLKTGNATPLCMYKYPMDENILMTFCSPVTHSTPIDT